MNLWKIYCRLFGHDFYFPPDEKYKKLLGGICRRCLELNKLDDDKKTGSIVVFNRYESSEKGDKALSKTPEEK